MKRAVGDVREILALIFIQSFIYLHSIDPYMVGRPVDIEIVKTIGQIPSII
jgi:hypothetical protein